MGDGIDGHPHREYKSNEGPRQYKLFLCIAHSQSTHCKQRVNTRGGYAPCTGHTPVPPRLGYEDKRSWGSSGYGQPPDGVLPCVGEVPGWCTTPGYDTYTGRTRTHHLTYTDRATRPGYVMYTFGVAPRVRSLHIPIVLHQPWAVTGLNTRTQFMDSIRDSPDLASHVMSLWDRMHCITLYKHEHM